MITRLKLKPGQKGTKKLLDKYGDSLVCVRYRYGSRAAPGKTVELIVERKPWTPTPHRCKNNTLVSVRIGFADKA